MQKILIVEDDIDIQDILKNHLIDAGYEVAVASDGVAGIAMFGDTIDLVLLDIMLPKTSRLNGVASTTLNLSTLEWYMAKPSWCLLVNTRYFIPQSFANFTISSALK